MSALGENTLTEPQAEPEVSPSITGESVEEWAARRRRELASKPERAIILPVPGYEERLSVQYRPLPYREAVKIEKRHEKNKDDAEQLLFIAADKLIAACERIVEPTGKDEYRDTGYRWGSKAATELFGCVLPEGTGARQALLAIFADEEMGEEMVVRHLGEYEEQRTAVLQKVNGEMVGESEAGERD